MRPVSGQGRGAASRQRHAFSLKWLLPLTAAAAIAGGLALQLSGQAAYAHWVWGAGTGLVLAFLLLDILGSLARGEFGLDLIAALAMAGALALGENLAGGVIALMYAGGQGLEGYAAGRARREMSALLARVPRSALRYGGDRLEEVGIAEIVGGDRLLVRRGEVLPVDGYVDKRSATLDQSALTGEPLPVRLDVGAAAMSGSTNAGDAFDLIAGGTARESTYAGIVRLVEAAQAAKAPMVRLADRYALWFLAVTLAAAAGAWVLSGDPERALAVLVVATPCPLILAVPVAVIAGISRCARKGVLVKGGGALERLAAVRTVLLDKTGTVTEGRPRLAETHALAGRDAGELLRLAASLDQGSHHTIARALVDAARERALDLATPTDVREESGAGITGTVEGRRIDLGGWEYVRTRSADDAAAQAVSSWIRREGTVGVVIAIDGRIAGAFLLGDRIRPEAGTVLRRLRSEGVRRLLLVTGDRRDLAEGVAAFLGVDEVIAEARPEDKTLTVERERPGGPVLMVGDGVNDAPALAAADVGVAMGARGAAASSESADVVILLDRLDRLVSAMRIARRSRGIALQSVYAGIGLSLIAMAAAGFGYLKPIEGALLQEAIDVAVILNALRALGQPLRNLIRPAGLGGGALGELEREHAVLADILEEIRAAADALGTLPAAACALRLEGLDAMLRQRLLPHEKHDDEEVYPRLQRAGAGNALAGMSRTHMEIKRYVHTLTYLRGLIGPQGPEESERRELVRLLDGLEAVLRLHFAQEEEIYRALEGE